MMYGLQKKLGLFMILNHSLYDLLQVNGIAKLIKPFQPEIFIIYACCSPIGAI
jgi:hypothetical protein